ncbi:MAG: hypothetical protein ACKVPX_07530 [Myxococcaceae bacterium]
MTSAVAHSPMPQVPAPSRFLDAVVPMCGALVGAGALIFGADHIGNALAPLTAGLISQRAKRATQATKSTLPAEAHQALVDTLKAQSSSLSIAAQIAVCLGWQRNYDHAALGLEKALANAGVEFLDMPAERRTSVVRDAVIGAFAGKTDWLAGKELALVTALPVAILYAASQLKWLAPLLFITVVAQVIAQPGVNRLAGWLRVKTTSPKNRHVHAAADTWFHRLVARIGDMGSRQPDLFHNGRHYLAEARRMLSSDLSDAAAASSASAGERRVALSLADMAATFPEVIIHDLWSENLAAQLHRYQTPDAYERIRRHLEQLQAKYDFLSLPTLYQHLDMALRPQDWQPAAAAS